MCLGIRESSGDGALAFRVLKNHAGFELLFPLPIIQMVLQKGGSLTSDHD